MKRALLALFLAVPGASQSIPLTQFCGVNNDSDPAAIQACEAQDAMNVESNRTGTTLRKRKGTSTFLTLPAGTAVNSIFALKNSAGNECLIIANNTGTLYRSVNSGSAVSFSTITSGARLYCQSDNGKAYCFSSSNDTPFSYDCATYYAEQQANGYPNGKFNAFTQDRQLIAGTTDYPNRLYISQAGSVSSFTPATDEISPWFEDIGRSGDKITGVYFLNGRVIVFKEYSIGGFNVTDQFNSTYYDISNRVGITGPESVLVHEGQIYFKASDNEFYRMDGTPGRVERLSNPIKRIVASAISGRTRYIILTEQADWDNGNYFGQGVLSAMSGSLNPGSVQSSTWTRSSSLNTAWEMVDVDTTAVSEFTDGFDSGSILTEGIGWTVPVGLSRFVEASSSLRVFKSTGSANNDFPRAISNVTASSGIWSLTFLSTSSLGTSITFYPISSSSHPLVNELDGYSFTIQPGVIGFTLHYSSTSDATPFSAISGLALNSSHTLTFSRSTEGVVTAYVDGALMGSLTDNRPITNYGTMLGQGSISSDIPILLDSVRTPGYYANIVSLPYDTYFATPTWGPYTASLSSTSDSAVTFKVQASPTGTGSWGTLTAQTLNSVVAATQRRYVRHQIRVEPVKSVSVSSASVYSATLNAVTTGQYITPCVEPGPGITSWGTLEMSGSFLGAGAFTVEDSTGTGCSDPGLGNTWTATSTGTTITISTGAAYKIRTTLRLGSSTDTSRMDSIIVNWTEGSLAPPAYVAYWDNGIYFSISTGTTGNNRVVKYDLNNDALWPFDMGWNSPVNFNNILYFGSTSTAKVMKYSANDPDSAPNSDDGSAINSYWRTKSLSAGDPFVEKQLDRISTVVRKEGGGSISGIWRVNGSTNSGSYSISLSTGVNVVRSNYSVPVGQVGTFFDLQFGNSSVYPFEILGLRLDLAPKSWRPLP